MKRLSSVSLLVLTLACAILLLNPTVSSAQILDDTVSTCTSLNCQAVRFAGTMFSFDGCCASPWVENVYAQPGECVRLDVTFEDDDLEMTVIAPNGSVYRNDDRAGSNLPLVVIGAPPNKGWYTVHLSHWNGVPLNDNFIMSYGRYNQGNPNCSGPTTPFVGLEPNGARPKAS